MKSLQSTVLDALAPLKSGATIAEISKITGLASTSITSAIIRMRAVGQIFCIHRPMRSRYFACPVVCAAAEPQVLAMWAAHDASRAERKRLYEAAAHRLSYVRLTVPRAINPAFVNSVKPEKAKPKVATPTRKGWGRNDPVHITADTIITICPPLPRALRTNTHSQY